MGLLIGVNTPKAMEPWKVINTQGNGPYAVKTLLGWVVNGPPNASTDPDDETPVAVVNRTSIVHLEKLNERQYINDFPENEYEEERQMSADDRKLLQRREKRKDCSTDLGVKQDKGKRLKDQMLLLKRPTANALRLSVEDTENAEKAIICHEQRRHFKEDFALLEKAKQCNRGSSLYKLDSIIDAGILRVGGRTTKMAMPTDFKHPMILLKHSRISKLILSHIHHQAGHSGHMLSKLLQRYWLSAANSSARRQVQYLADLFWKRWTRNTFL